MALIECIECGNPVSDDAEACPHCGYRLRGREFLVRCRHCGNDVIPQIVPHDTVSKYCPICQKPVTGLAGRRVLLVFVAVFFLVVLGFILSTISRLFS